DARGVEHGERVSREVLDRHALRRIAVTGAAIVEPDRAVVSCQCRQQRVPHGRTIEVAHDQQHRRARSVRVPMQPSAVALNEWHEASPSSPGTSSHRLLGTWIGVASKRLLNKLSNFASFGSRNIAFVIQSALYEGGAG